MLKLEDLEFHTLFSYILSAIQLVHGECNVSQCASIANL